MHHSPLVKELRAQLGGENVISASSELAVYDCDALTLYRHPPEAVVFPRTARQVAAVVEIANRHGAVIVPRGAGTGHSGGCVPVARSIVVTLTRMNRLLEINLRDRMAVVHSGVTNMQLGRALAGAGCFFAPDPSGQGAGTIGGNVAANAVAPHWLKYGAAVNHILGLETVLADGSIVQLGPIDDPAGFDLIGLLAGSEGMLGIVTKVWLRLTPGPQDQRTIHAVFNSVADAANAATQIIAAGIIPSAIELIDQELLAVTQEPFARDLADNAGIVLVIECHGPTPLLDRQQDHILAICKNNQAAKAEPSSPGQNGKSLCNSHKSMLGAIGRLSPDYLIEDGIAPRTQLPSLWDKINEISHNHQVRILKIAHLGYGSVQAIILFDQRDRASVDRALAAGSELLEQCIALGGSVSAEHGIDGKNVDLMPRQFNSVDLEAMLRVRHSFDSLGRFNPGKVLSSESRTFLIKQ